MNKKNKYLKVLLVFMIYLTSCLPQVVPNGTTVTQQEFSTRNPGSTHIAPPASSTTTAVIDIDPQKNCIAISSAPDDRKIDGTVIFLDNWGQRIVLMGENELQIPEEFKGNNGNSEQSVSPNGNFLMYRQVTYEPAQSHIVVITSDGQVVRDFPDNQKWVSGTAWLSNEYIRYPMKDQVDDEQLRLYALDMETGKNQELRIDLPDLAATGSPNWGVDDWAIYFGFKKGVNIVYDSSLTRVVYPKIQSSYPFYPVTLYDIQKNAELATIQLSGSGDPKWSPDGKHFSIIGVDPATQARDIYIVPRDGGQFMPLTNLSKLYPKANFESYSWAPNGQRIAFWVDIEESQAVENASSLILFDLVTLEMTDLCIKGFGSNPPLGIKISLNLRGQPIWSPDGKKLLITQYDTNTREVVDILIDLENQIAYPIGKDLEPIGWMN